VPETLTLLLVFGLVSLASQRIGRWFTAVGLPHITGYLATGAVAGAFALGVLPEGTAGQLRFIDEIALGVIAFVAGSELYIPDLRRRLRPILSLAAGVTLVGVVVLGVAIFLLTGILSFTADLDTPARIATALLGASVLLALSPPSTIAVIKEVGARGPFTSTVLSVTIVMDVVVIVAFSTAASIAVALVTGGTLDITFLLVLLLDLALATGLGIALGRLLGAVLRRGLPMLVTASVVLALGFGVYELASLVGTWSATNLPFEIYLEPLLLTMVAGFTVTNLTDQRDTFEEVLHEVGPGVYVAFFTLTGVSLKLDTLVVVLPAAIALFVVRIGAIAAGTALGARWAGAGGAIRNRSWLALVTQAGIALGLAREAGLQFPTLGSAFTTLVIAVVVLNEVFGPMFLKYVLEQVGETADDRDRLLAAIHGRGRTARLLADRLEEDDWAVTWTVAPEERSDVEPTSPVTAEATGTSRPATTPEGTHHDTDASDWLGAVGEALPDALVALDGDDHDNLRICTEAVGAGVRTVIARVRDEALLEDFLDLGVVVVDPTTADVTLLETAVRTPDTASLFLSPDGDHATRQVTAGAAGGRQLRELRLPHDVLVLTVRHGRASLVPDGFTRIHEGDQLTLLGPPAALAEAEARLTN
jgi:Trk K+ transport system NAD-binding subunit/Kef-type K+ transport system membrane component KefB